MKKFNAFIIVYILLFVGLFAYLVNAKTNYEIQVGDTIDFTYDSFVGEEAVDKDGTASFELGTAVTPQPDITQIVGKKVGTEFEYTYEVPADDQYYPDYIGKTITFKATVTDVTKPSTLTQPVAEEVSEEAETQTEEENSEN